MDKLKMHSLDGVARNIERIGKLFPNAITEVVRGGRVEHAIDFDVLRQELSGTIVEGREECYQFTWPDKKKAMLAANAPITATLRPVVADSVGRDGTPGGFDSENLYIEGDNLEVLKLLQETYLGKVKMIYIDPPYNTGNDFVYEDDFAQSVDEYMANSGQYDEEGNRMVTNTKSNGRFHTDWLNMIYPRLKLAKDLLANDGVIFVSIDENEVANLRKAMDDVFGEMNVAGEIIWKNSSKNDQDFISIQHEYILVYCKCKADNTGEWLEPKEGIDEIISAFNSFREKYGDDWVAIHSAAQEWYKTFPETSPIYANQHYSWMDERGVYFASDISGPHFGQYRYDVIHPVTGKAVKQPASGWRYPESTMLERIKQGVVHFGKDETKVPCNKTYLIDTVNQNVGSVKYKDGRAASKKLTALMGTNCFTNPKDSELLSTLFKSIGLNNGDIILDFFSGSGTTGETVMNIALSTGLDIHFLLVQVAEDLDRSLDKATGSTKQVLNNAISLCDSLNSPHLLTEIGKERIRRAGKKIKEEAGLSTPADLDIGFRCLRLDESNMQQVYYTPDAVAQRDLFSLVDNVKPDRTPEDLLFQVMLDLGVLLSSSIEVKEIAGKKVFNVADGFLLACFDHDVTDETVRAIAQMKPYYAVFRDSSMANDSVATNFDEIFKSYSPDTVRKVL